MSYSRSTRELSGHEQIRDLEDMLLATFNILEDFALERRKNEQLQSATFNILDDASIEKLHLQDTQKAILNILEDFELEKLKVVNSLHEKEVLLKEIHHRVKNNLQITSSLLSLQIDYVNDPRAREIFIESQGRISSIALVHEKLYKSGDLSRINFTEYTESLAQLLFSSFGVRPDRIHLNLSQEQHFLKIDVAVPLGLIINELLSNCIKHAFPNGRGGEISIALKSEAGELRSISFADNGIGLPENFDLDKTGTLGLQLVQTLVRQLDAKFIISKTGGTAFIIDFSTNKGIP